MADVTGRMLALLATLQAGRPFSGVELASRLGVSPRTVRRDIERLRGHGYPVATQPGPGGFYRLEAGRSLPPLVLDDDEAVAILLALARLGSEDSIEGAGRRTDTLGAAATRAYGKLDQFLPARLRPQVVALRATLETGPQAAPPISPRLLADLSTFTSRREVITFDYASPAPNRSRRTSARRCEPHRLVHLNLRWYLFAWDTGRRDWRTFRADRITRLGGTGRSFTPRPLPEEGVVEHLRQGMGKDREVAEVTVWAPTDRVADAVRHQAADVEPLPDGRTRLRLRVDSWQWLVLNLAFLDADFVIHAPDELRAAVNTFADRLRAATQPGLTVGGSGRR